MQNKLFCFRVLIDSKDENDVFRDIELPSNFSFHDLHLAIQKAFSFDNSQMASFYESDEFWERGQEIALMDMGMGDSDLKLMSTTLLHDLCSVEGNKFLYVFDFFLMWCFLIELVRITEIDSNESYPKISMQFGESPDQYAKEPDDMFGGMDDDSVNFSEFDEGDDDDFEELDPDDFYQ